MESITNRPQSAVLKPIPICASPCSGPRTQRPQGFSGLASNRQRRLTTMHAQTFSRLPSPVPGQPSSTVPRQSPAVQFHPSNLHPSPVPHLRSATVHGPPSIVRIAPRFHISLQPVPNPPVIRRSAATEAICCAERDCFSRCYPMLAKMICVHIPADHHRCI
jgi:hypothetical protein